MKYKQWHERTQAEWEAQRKRLADAVAITDRSFTERELADAEADLAQPTNPIQPELSLRGN